MNQFTNNFSLVGSIICGAICEKFGYLKVFHCISATWLIGNIITFFLNNAWVLIGGRIVKGIAIGFTFTSIPIYGYETIPHNKRGAVLSLTLFSCTLGNFTIFILYIILDYFEAPPIWMRIFWSFEVIPGLVAMILTFYIPESPKWLATNCEWTTAANVLQSIQLNNSSQEEKKMKDERLKLGDKHFVIKEYSSGICIKSCPLNRLFGKKYIKEMVTGILVQVFLVLTIITKLSQSFESLCNSCLLFHKNDIKMANFFLLSMRVLFSAIPILISDAIRRKDAIFFSIFIITCIMITYIVMFVFFSNEIIPSPTDLDWMVPTVFYDQRASLMIGITVVADVLYQAILLPISWLLIVETFSSSSRIQGWVVSTSLFWFLETVTSVAFPFLLQLLRQWLFLIIVVICVTGAIFAAKLTETKGRFGLDSDYILLESKPVLEIPEDMKEDSIQKLKQINKESPQTSVLTATDAPLEKLDKKYESINRIPKVQAFHNLQPHTIRKGGALDWETAPDPTRNSKRSSNEFNSILRSNNLL